MQLSDELFRDFQKSLGLPKEVAPGTDHGRSTPRVETDDETGVSVEIEPFGKAMATRRKTLLVNLGPGGVAILDDRTWRTGEKFIIHLRRVGGTTIPLVCTVRNAKLIGARFRIGAAFTGHAELSSPDLLRGVNGVALSAGLADCAPQSDAGRKAHRQRMDQAHSHGQLHANQNGANDVREVEVVDLSNDGVGLVSDGPMKIGEHALIRLCPPGGRSVTRMIRVANCRPTEDGRHRIGGRFVHRSGLARLPQMLFGWFRSSDE